MSVTWFPEVVSRSTAPAWVNGGTFCAIWIKRPLPKQ
jgi:hypothetical protein